MPRKRNSRSVFPNSAGTGFWLLYKRLEKGHFKWKKDDANHSVMISEQQLGWLLDGLKIEQKSAFQPVKKDYI